MQCKGCQYSLINLTEPRCPECGRAFNPNDWRTYDFIPQWSSSKARRRTYLIWICTLGPIVVLAALNLNERTWPYVRWMLAMVVVAIVLSWIIPRATRAPDPQTPKRPKQVFLWVAFLGIFLPIILVIVAIRLILAFFGWD